MPYQPYQSTWQSIPKLLKAWSSGYASCDTLLREQGTCSRSVPNVGPPSWTRVGRLCVVWRLNRQRCRVPLGPGQVPRKRPTQRFLLADKCSMHFRKDRRGGHFPVGCGLRGIFLISD